MTRFDRFIERHTVLCYSIAMPISGALGVLLALGLWKIIIVNGVCRIAC